MRPPTHRRAALAATATGLALTVLTGCGAPGVLGLQRNTAVLSSRAVVEPDQAQRIVTRALAQAEHADAVRTLAAAQTAYTGLALDVAKPTYTVDGVLDKGSDRSAGALAAGTPPSRVVVGAGSDFPRRIVAVATPAGAPGAQLSVLESTDVRTPYRVAARVDLLPGATLPRTTPNVRGAAMLAPDASGLLATPVQALTDYAKLLQTGKDGDTPFAADAVVGQVRSESAKQAKSVAKVATYHQTHSAQTAEVQAVRTADGGALVVGAIVRHDVFTVKKGAGAIKPPAAYAALAKGLKEIKHEADVRTVQMVALVLPPAGASGGQARVVGFTELPVEVTAS